MDIKPEVKDVSGECADEIPEEAVDVKVGIKLEIEVDNEDEPSLEGLEFKELLIKEIRLRPVIWNKKDLKHSRRKFVSAAWEEVASLLHSTPQECKRLWKSLTDCYRIHTKNMLESSGNPDSVKWKYFKTLAFLEKNYREQGNFSAVSNVIRSSTPVSTAQMPAVAMSSTTSESQSEHSQQIVSNQLVQQGDGSSTCSSSESTTEDEEPVGQQIQIRRRYAGRKRRSAAPSRDELIQKLLLQQLAAVNRELEQEKKDSVSTFCLYMNELMGDLPPQKRRKVEWEILQVVYNAFEAEK